MSGQQAVTWAEPGMDPDEAQGGEGRDDTENDTLLLVWREAASGARGPVHGELEEILSGL